MRWIFVALILLNGVYLGWEFWRRTSPQPVAEQHAVVESAPEGQALVLLTERLPSAQSAVPPPPLVTQKAPSATIPASAPTTRSAAVVDNKPAPKSSVPDGLLCYSIGPIPKRELAEGVIQQLNIADVSSRLQEIGTDKAARHWVILPPQSSRQQAQRLLRELQARKIDSYLVSSGELTNAISLGLFSREALATGVRDKVREAGYPAEIRLKEPAESQFWLRLRPGQPIEKIEKLLESRLAGENGIKISNTPCEMFAQAK